MSNEELFQQVQLLLQRKLTPEEHKFLVLAGEVLNRKEERPHKADEATAKIA